MLLAYLGLRFIFLAASSLPPAFSAQASAVSQAALEVAQAWPLPEVACAPAVGTRAAEPPEADCAAAGARPAEAIVDAAPERAQPVSAVVDCLDAQVRGDCLAVSPEDDSPDGSLPVDSAPACWAELPQAGLVPDEPQAGLVLGDSAVLSPADCWTDSLLADSVERAELRRDARSMPADSPVDSADSPLALVVPDGPCLAERQVCQRLPLLVSQAEQPSLLDVLPLQRQVSAFALRSSPAVVRDAPPEPVVVSQKAPAGVEVFSWPRPVGSQSPPEARLHVPQSMPFRPQRLRASELLQLARSRARQRCRVHSPRPQFWLPAARSRMSAAEPPPPHPAHSDSRT